MLKMWSKTVLLLFLASQTAFAVEMRTLNHPQLGLGLSSVSLQNASGDYSKRESYNFFYRQPVYKNAFSKFGLIHAPESDRKSQRLDVRQNFSTLYLLFGVSYPLLFRFNFSFGPTYTRTTTEYSFDSDSEDFSNQSSGFALSTGIDYSYLECCEVGLGLLIHDRPSDQKIDRYYKISFSFNLPAGYQTESVTW